MFLTSDNKLKVKWLKWGGVITLVLVLLGVVWFDKPLYILMRHLDNPIWKVFDRVFDVKMWLILTGLLLLLVYAKKTLDSNIKYKNDKNQFSVVSIIKDFMTKVRTNYAFLIFSSVLSAGIVAQIIKVIVGRFRPIFFEALDINGRLIRCHRDTVRLHLQVLLWLECWFQNTNR